MMRRSGCVRARLARGSSNVSGKLALLKFGIGISNLNPGQPTPPFVHRTHKSKNSTWKQFPFPDIVHKLWVNCVTKGTHSCCRPSNSAKQFAQDSRDEGRQLEKWNAVGCF